jgi:hypothetical protein
MKFMDETVLLHVSLSFHANTCWHACKVLEQRL